MMRSIVALGAGLALTLSIGCSQLDSSLSDLEAGDCVRDPGRRFQVRSLDHVDCDDEDAALKVTRVFTIKGYEEFPGPITMDEIINRDCTTDTTAALHPTEESWDQAGDREVVCFRKL